MSGLPTTWPAHWKRTTIGNLAAVVTSGSRDWKPYYHRGEGVFILTQNVGMRSLDLSEPFHVDPPADDPARRRSAVQKDDLLINIVGAVGTVARIPEDLPNHWVCQSVALVRLSDPELSEFLELYLSSPDGGQRFFAEKTYGIGRPHLSFADIKEIPVPIPPPEERAGIVATMNRYLSIVEAAEQHLRAAGRRIDDFVDSALNQLVAEAVTYPAKPLDTLAERITSGSRDWKPYYEQGTGVFVLTQNVRMRSLDVSEPFHVDPPPNDPARARSVVRQDDILVTIVGANCGNLARVQAPLPDHYVCQSLALVRLRDPGISEWLELYMSAPAGGQSHFERCYYGQGRPHLSFANIKQMEIPLPPEGIRRAAVRRFAEQNAAASGLRGRIDAGLARLSDLRRAIFAEVLAGRVDVVGATEQIADGRDSRRAVLIGS